MRGALLRAQADLVAFAARDPPSLRDELGTHPLVNEAIALEKLPWERRPERLGDLLAGVQRDSSHVLDSCSDHDVVNAGRDERCGEVDRLLG